jgi:DNA-binding LacI/PurR family transcriptional regulator
VDQDSAGLGANAAKLAMSIIKNKNSGGSRSVLLPAKLIVRTSTQRT